MTAEADVYPIDPQRALPAVSYRDATNHREEMTRIFRGGWVWVGTADQVAEPGDHFPAVIGDQPVIVLRQQSGDIAALSNLCAHRGTLLIDEPGTAKRFQCPYHAWTYSDSGRLLAAPHTDRSDVDRDAHCLPMYRAEVWHGLVFVSLKDDVPTVSEQLRHLDPIIGDYDLATLHHWTAERTEGTWAANWKLVMANAMESYHLFKVHPDTLEPYTPTADAYYRVGCAAGTATGGASTRDADYTLISLPPNIVLVITGGSLLWQAVVPEAVDRTRIVAGGAYQSPSPSDSTGLSRWVGKAAAKASELVVPDFLPEDKQICERGQAAAIGDFTPGVIVPMEHVVTDFHDFLNQRMAGIEPPAPRTSDEVGVAKREP